VNCTNRKDVVKKGYNQIAPTYLTVRSKDSEDVHLLEELVWRLPKGAKVLDAGCGAGVPVTRYLAQFFNVTGVDFSAKQLELARKLVPSANFTYGDMTDLAFDDESFDAICSYYAIIHIPRTQHGKILNNFLRMLKHGGLALLCLGAGELPNDIADFHGTRMYWSHYGPEKYLQILGESGCEIIWSKIIKDATYANAAHLFVLARKP
jgi:ubiquinone/menaquinone biosynthesis C-methylase UbiE